MAWTEFMLLTLILVLGQAPCVSPAGKYSAIVYYSA